MTKTGGHTAEYGGRLTRHDEAHEQGVLDEDHGPDEGIEQRALDGEQPVQQGSHRRATGGDEAASSGQNGR